jgi:hypothetical protein
VALAGAFGLGTSAFAQSAQSDRQIYESACAACHGSDGRGGSAVTAGYPLVPPDFTDCRFASREAAADWFAIAHEGGPVRGFDRMMPAFGSALARDSLSRAVDHVRTFCTDESWPRGELNLPRALVTTKAYPEDEAVVTVAVEEGAVTNTFIYERRFGARNQVELIVPLAFSERSQGDWTGGIGDIGLEFKRVLAHSRRRGGIVSVGAELVTPTGSTERGIGSGAAVFEPYVALGQVLPADAFLQIQAGGELPFDRDRPDEVFWRAAAGRTFTSGEFGRAWTPMVELLGTRELSSGESSQWDVVPQMQVTLNTRQHVMLNAGLRIPINDREGRSTQAMVYLLWDWFDGGFREGW